MRAETRRSRARAGSRGFSTTSSVLEAAMVMGWFVALILGEKTVSDAADARRGAEDAAQKTASASSGAYCLGSAADQGGLSRVSVHASVAPNGKPDIKRALSAVAGLGVGSQRTFPNYTLPLSNVHVTAASDDGQGHHFVADRSLGCLERPLDTPSGSLEAYRSPIWLTNLMGY